MSSIYLETIDALVEHSALFPPTEQTYALHELVHIVKQIPNIGPPKFNNLFMYERVNATLKRMIKNRCNSMPSIVKAYAVRFSCYVFPMYLYVFPMYLYVFLMYLYVFSMYFQCIFNVFVCIFNVFVCIFNVFVCIFNVFSMYFQCIFNVFVCIFNDISFLYNSF